MSSGRFQSLKTPARRDGLGFRHVKPREHLVLYSEPAAVEHFRRAGLRIVHTLRPLAGTLGKIAVYLKRA